MKHLLRKTPLVNSAYFRIAKRVRSYKGSQRLKKELKTPGDLKIVIGAASVHERNWIPTDIEYLNILNKNHWRNFFRHNSIDAILAEHVWEHLSVKEGIAAAKNCYAYLKPGGYIRIAVPDGLHPDQNYIDEVKAGGSGSGADDHKVLYTYKTLADLFEQAGFQTELLEYFDEEHNFHAKKWCAEEGMIHRSKQYDQRNRNGQLNYTSIILDAKKV